MATKTTYLKIQNLNATLKRLPDEVQDEFRKASWGIAVDVAAGARGQAREGVAGLVRPTIKPKRERQSASVTWGGTKRLKRHRKSRTPRGLKVDVDAGALNLKSQTVGAVAAGAEYGSKHYKQFSPWRGSDDEAGYFIWPTIRAKKKDIINSHLDALDAALKAI